MTRKKKTKLSETEKQMKKLARQYKINQEIKDQKEKEKEVYTVMIYSGLWRQILMRNKKRILDLVENSKYNFIELDIEYFFPEVYYDHKIEYCYKKDYSKILNRSTEELQKIYDLPNLYLEFKKTITGKILLYRLIIQWETWLSSRQLQEIEVISLAEKFKNVWYEKLLREKEIVIEKIVYYNTRNKSQIFVKLTDCEYEEMDLYFEREYLTLLKMYHNTKKFNDILNSGISVLRKEYDLPGLKLHFSENFSAIWINWKR